MVTKLRPDFRPELEIKGMLRHLDRLRRDEAVDMDEVVPYLMSTFDLDQYSANEVLTYWKYNQEHPP